MKTTEVVIVGAGPAGLAAAIQLLRYRITPLIFEAVRLGGLLHNANLVENYPGFPRGIRGPELVELFIEQAECTDVQVTHEEVLELSYDEKVFQALTPVDIYQSRVAVIASGTQPRLLTDIEIPDDLQDRVYYEVYPLLDIENKHVVIIGAGDAAFDYALNLSSENDVVILNRGQEHSCLPLLWERAVQSKRISYRTQVVVRRLTEQPGGSMALECLTPHGLELIPADYLIGAIGREPRLGFITPALLAQSQELSEQGIFHIIGDVKNGSYRQTAIAVGEGILAAMKIHRYLKETGS